MPRNPPETPEEYRARGRAHYWKNRDAILEKRRVACLDPAKLEARREYHRRYYSTTVKRRYTYGVTPGEFDARLAEQGGRCAICGTDKPSGKGGWHLDHDHAFPRRDRRGHRGILCAHCNVMLGMAFDDPERLMAAATYLAGWNAREVFTAAVAA